MVFFAENFAKNRKSPQQQILADSYQQPHDLHDAGGGIMPDNQTVNNDAEKHISPYGFGLLGEIVSDSEPADLPLPRYLVYSKLKAVENARYKLSIVVESDILRAEKGITAEDEQLLKSLHSAEICIRDAYERLEDVWDIYTKTIDGFMYMRAKREAYLDALEALSKGRTISIDIPQKTEKPVYRYE